MHKRTVTAVLAGVAATLSIAAPSGAKVFGANGRLVYDGSNGVYIANSDGSQSALLEQYSCCASWSPDGTRIALPFLAPDGVRLTTAIVNPDGSALTMLPLPDPTLNLAGGYWSPDGKRLVVQGWDDGNPSRNGVYTEATDGSGLVRVTTGFDAPADFSPDGSRIVFFRQAQGPRPRYALFVVGVNGGPVRQISPWQLDAGTASWSPNGQWIITDDGLGHLYEVHPDGSGLHVIALRVTSRQFAKTPGWSPDGTKIVFALFTGTSPGTGQEAIYTANADGSDMQSTGLQGDFPDWGAAPTAP
jgi:Tol biopolymer transport system component